MPLGSHQTNQKKVKKTGKKNWNSISTGIQATGISKLRVESYQIVRNIHFIIYLPATFDKVSPPGSMAS